MSRYAPLVRLHPLERYFPLDPDLFIAHSELRWAHDRACGDHTAAALGTIDPYDLGHGRYGHQAASIGLLSRCLDDGPRFGSDELTRPGQTGKPGLATDEGFFLDLDNSWRAGQKPVAGEPYTVPVYYTYVPGRFITYWFMYGFNDPGIGWTNWGPIPPLPVYASLDRHEGDWERIVVRLDRNENPIGVEYFQHNCDGKLVDWSVMGLNGHLFNETHPIVYSALGSHASYFEVPLSGGYLFPCFSGPPAFDLVADGGAQWETWLSLRNVDVEGRPWYGESGTGGYGGAWGEVGSRIPGTDWSNTGPLGPPWKRADGGGLAR